MLLFLAATAPRAQASASQEGVASWHEGGRTACGATWRGADLVAAHRSLPFGSRVEVTNLHNGRRVTVRIIDRGPYGRGRVIDLSHAAARELNMIHRGTARVRLMVAAVTAPTLDPRGSSR